MEPIIKTIQLTRRNVVNDINQWTVTVIKHLKRQLIVSKSFGLSIVVNKSFVLRGVVMDGCYAFWSFSTKYE